MPVPLRLTPFQPGRCRPSWSWGITRRFHRLSPRKGLVAYALRTRAPLSLPRREDPVRLACIRPAASVHPEPGSNSSLYYCCTCFFFLLGLRYVLVPYPATRASRRTSRTLASFAGLKLSKNLVPTPIPSFPLSRGRKRVQNYNLFPYVVHLFQTFC